MTTEIVPVVPDIAKIDEREREQAETAAQALTVAVAVLQALEVDASEIDETGFTYRGLGVARRIFPLLDELEVLAKQVRQRVERGIGLYLQRTKSTSVVLAGTVPYRYEPSYGTYAYDAEKLREALEHVVGSVITKEELDAICPVTLVPEQVIPAHKVVNVDGNAMARLLKKRGGQDVSIVERDAGVATVMQADGTFKDVPHDVTIRTTLEGLVNNFRSRPVKEPTLKREK